MRAGPIRQCLRPGGLGVDVLAGSHTCHENLSGMALPLALLVIDEGVAEEGLERRDALHHRAHGQEGVEPVSELAGEALCDEVCWVPFIPVFPVFTVLDGAESYDSGV